MNNQDNLILYVLLQMERDYKESYPILGLFNREEVKYKKTTNQGFCAYLQNRNEDSKLLNRVKYELDDTRKPMTRQHAPYWYPSGAIKPRLANIRRAIRRVTSRIQQAKLETPVLKETSF